ncbi:hypothetical protein EV186_104770 [Labedaea rhizosphaerae]|uniref:DUF6985 domain-containing protein n=1 Tax=Labedaea rhizosphaerae TaxID=598644 RepID=A0A4R6SA18_LABRH|nr:hypothetical protein EV186_104770 [Labedaea rhizosphaerae]
MVDDGAGWYRSAPLPVPMLGGAPCEIIVEGYDEDQRKDDFHEAIRTFLALDPSVLTAAAPSIFAYYRDFMSAVAGDDDTAWDVKIDGPGSVLDHVQLGREPIVTRDQHVYVSLECECDWEPEHGLQLVFRDGRTVTKVGPYDGHLT